MCLDFVIVPGFRECMQEKISKNVDYWYCGIIV